MLRTLAPSVRKSSGGPGSFVSPMAVDTGVGKRKSALRGPLRKIKGLNDSDEDEDDDVEQTKKKMKNGQDAIDAEQKETMEQLRRLVLSSSLADRQEYEVKIKSILSKPYVCPIPGYQLSGRALGGGGNAARRAKYDPFAEKALVVYTPPEYTQEQLMTMDKNKILVHVVIDPVLGLKLRPHQREGVKFMYDCVTGVNIPGHHGCIMADEMGLGKTFQCVTLIHTLLEQSPQACPAIENAIIAAPSSLVKNWGNEFVKWLGPGRVSTMVIDGGSSSDIDKNIEYFMTPSTCRLRQRPYPVLIISYETLRIHSAALKGGEVGLLLCDEGHRLKNKDSQTYQVLNEINVKRRVLLSGTPIQNDLLEYYSLVDFVNSGILGTANEFNKRFGNPIIRGRDGDATDKEREVGLERQRELIGIVNKCMIRRTQALLTMYLPTKHDLVICCGLTEIQKFIYDKCVSSKQVKSAVNAAEKNKEGGKDTLKAINFLKKLCNHPALIEENLKNGDFGLALDSNLSELFGGREVKPQLSGKVAFLDILLAQIKSSTDDRVVLISNYTQTLDLFEKLCRQRGYQFVRLDGTMTVKKRAKLVADFNDPFSSVFIFMLSSKAGGCGLNLIGANRLVMFDPDWNPANDAQAMARCWRDGQKKDCYTYRLVATGTIEEKIFQRQLSKKALSESIVDADEEVERHFTQEDLKQLFRFEEGTTSHTHSVLKCQRCFKGAQATDPPSDATSNSDLKDWHHAHDKRPLPDVMAKYAWDAGATFAFFQKSHEQKKTV